MAVLRIMIYLVGKDTKHLNDVWQSLFSIYGFKTVEIVGVVGDEPLAVNGKILPNIPAEKIHLVKCDYIIVFGLESKIFLTEVQKNKNLLAEKIKIPADKIIFDFEICSGNFLFSKVCLVIIFNHRFDKNLPLLRRIYCKRFSNIRFLVPFYDKADSDVIPVYESSHQFQGYLIQAYEKLKDLPCTHYLFIGDDLVINPQFTEKNFVNLSRTKNSLGG